MYASKLTHKCLLATSNCLTRSMTCTETHNCCSNYLQTCLGSLRSNRCPTFQLACMWYARCSCLQDLQAKTLKRKAAEAEAAAARGEAPPTAGNKKRNQKAVAAAGGKKAAAAAGGEKAAELQAARRRRQLQAVVASTGTERGPESNYKMFACCSWLSGCRCIVQAAARAGAAQQEQGARSAAAGRQHVPAMDAPTCQCVI